jgi:protein tyrosine/serine phosphatase
MRFFSLTFALFFFSFFSSVPFRQSPARSSSSSPPIAQKLSLRGISNAARVSDSLFRGAQPHLSALGELKNLGVTTIVDLRRESPSLRAQERSRAESLGMHFISIPVGVFSTPTSAQLAEFFSLLREVPPQKIFVHCEYGEDRTGVFIASYRIAFERWSPDQAISEMLAFRFHRHWHPSMANFVRALPDSLSSDPTLKSSLTN